jgi:hypothetical protein
MDMPFCPLAKEDPMQRMSLDSAATAVQEFVRSLNFDPEGIELELNGRVVCKVISPYQLTEEERDELLKGGVSLMREAQSRNKGVPAKVIEREVREAVDEVRRGKAQ